MLKYYDYAITFAEFPDEICLAVNITNCPGFCENCSEPWLKNDVGVELTNAEIDKLISEHKDITVFGLMGGDSDHEDVIRIARYIHDKYINIKVGMYSGKEYLSKRLLNVLDLYKIGRWIMPKGEASEWHKTNNGAIQFPWSNQLLFEKTIIDDEEVWENITYKFRNHIIGNPAHYIINN